MGKRDIGATNGAAEDGGHRLKRRKESGHVQDLAQDASGQGVQNGMVVGGGNRAESVESVREQGLQWYQVLKDATDKTGRVLSPIFLKQPPKRQYPDYYQIIQRPIAFEDIRKKLVSNGYESLHGVKEDFDLCFNNAREYNMKESDVWKDAKTLQKLINKEFSKVFGGEQETDVAAPNGAPVLATPATEDTGKGKPPSMNRLLKSRLTKLTEMTAEDGRVKSSMFMELPNKKDWAIYYQQIKRPMALEMIHKRLKRKEYENSQDFANDVELVFQNAMEFNQEGTGIYIDAQSLRDEFKRLMSDLPAPHALPQYSKPTIPKIKLKLPTLQQPSQPAASSSTALFLAPANAAPVDTPEPAPAPQPAPPKIKITPKAVVQPTAKSPEIQATAVSASPPAAKVREPVKAATPAPTLPRMSLRSSTAASTAPAAPSASTSTSAVSATPALPVAPMRSGNTQVISPSIVTPAAKAPATASKSTVPSTPSAYTYGPGYAPPHDPNANWPLFPGYGAQDSAYPGLALPQYGQPSQAPSQPQYTQPAQQQEPQVPQSQPPPPPPPPPQPSLSLRSVTLVTDPRGRVLRLDHRDGVTCWALRLGVKEHSLCVRNILRLPSAADGDGDESSEDEAEDEAMDVDAADGPAVTRNGKKRKGKGRAQKVSPKEKAAKGKKRTSVPSEIQISLNGTAVKETVSSGGEWLIHNIPIGMNTVEISEKPCGDGNMVWKVFAHRIEDS